MRGLPPVAPADGAPEATDAPRRNGHKPRIYPPQTRARASGIFSQCDRTRVATTLDRPEICETNDWPRTASPPPGAIPPDYL